MQIGFCQIAQFAALASPVSTWIVVAHLGQLLSEGGYFLKYQAQKKNDLLLFYKLCQSSTELGSKFLIFQSLAIIDLDLKSCYVTYSRRINPHPSVMIHSNILPLVDINEFTSW